MGTNLHAPRTRTPEAQPPPIDLERSVGLGLDRTSVAPLHLTMITQLEPPANRPQAKHFCALEPTITPEAASLHRTAMTQPGVYFTLDAPFVRIIGLFSNSLEDPGVISSEKGKWTNVPDIQLDYLQAQLSRIKEENYSGAVLLTVHHPPFSYAPPPKSRGTHGNHAGSPNMLRQIDTICKAQGVYPHAILSGHAHNYQRFTRTVNTMQIPFLVAGCGGHSPLSPMRATYRTPYKIDNTLTLENYDTTDYGYLRVIVNATTMRIEFHPQHDGGTTKTPNDAVTVTLATHAVS